MLNEKPGFHCIECVISWIKWGVETEEGKEDAANLRKWEIDTKIVNPHSGNQFNGCIHQMNQGRSRVDEANQNEYVYKAKYPVRCKCFNVSSNWLDLVFIHSVFTHS